MATITKKELIEKLVFDNENELISVEQKLNTTKESIVSAKNLLDNEIEMFSFLEDLLNERVSSSLSKGYIQFKIENEKSYIKDYQDQFDALDKQRSFLEKVLRGLNENSLALKDLLENLKEFLIKSWLSL